MTSTESTKQQIKALLGNYDKVVEEKRFSKYNEEMAEKEFIRQLFRVPGCVENSGEAAAEEKSSKGCVDYGRINGIPEFFLEAKSSKEDLDNQKFGEQAINHAWHEDCAKAALINFKEMKTYNAELKTTPFRNRVKIMPCDEFLDTFCELSFYLRKALSRSCSIKKPRRKSSKRV